MTIAARLYLDTARLDPMTISAQLAVDFARLSGEEAFMLYGEQFLKIGAAAWTKQLQ